MQFNQEASFASLQAERDSAESEVLACRAQISIDNAKLHSALERLQFAQEKVERASKASFSDPASFADTSVEVIGKVVDEVPAPSCGSSHPFKGSEAPFGKRPWPT